jgi:hypothetical protein
MPNNCPICGSELIPDHGQYPPKTGGKQAFGCQRCGMYMLSRSCGR